MRILIVKLGAIGDVVHTLPALAALRGALPASRIAWAVERGGAAQILRDNPCLDELIEVDTRGWRKDLLGGATRAAMRAAVRRLRRPGFDVALDFQGLIKPGVIARLSGAPRRVGFASDALREPASAWLLTEQVRVDDRDHIIEKNLSLVAQLGVPAGGEYAFPVGLAREDELFAEKQLVRRGGDVAIINPGGGWPTKLWSVEGFAAIADRLYEAYGWRSVVTFGPGEESLARSVVERARSGAVELLASTLKQFFAPAAARTPIVGLYGPTPARRNGPFLKDDVVVERFDLDCRTDCFRRSCGHTSCMKIPVEAVWRAVEQRVRSSQFAFQSSGQRQ
jgi:heptosyltransferase I